MINNALPGDGRGCQTFTGPQRISRCSIRENGECTKGENRQEAKHRQISHFRLPFSPISTSRRSRNFLMPNQVDSENITALPAASTRRRFLSQAAVVAADGAVLVGASFEHFVIQNCAAALAKLGNHHQSAKPAGSRWRPTSRFDISWPPCA